MSRRLLAVAGAHQRWLLARLERNRRQLHARTATDGLTQTIQALAETLVDDARPEVWRLAAARTSQLLALLNLGATRLGQPLPAETVKAIQELRIWSVTMVERSGTAIPPTADPELGAPRGQIVGHDLRPGGPTTVSRKVPLRPALTAPRGLTGAVPAQGDLGVGVPSTSRTPTALR
jgi:hypothetical protein